MLCSAGSLHSIFRVCLTIRVCSFVVLSCLSAVSSAYVKSAVLSAIFAYEIALRMRAAGTQQNIKITDSCFLPYPGKATVALERRSMDFSWLEEISIDLFIPNSIFSITCFNSNR